MKKETFVQVINLIKEQQKIDEEFTDALSLVCDGHSIYFGSMKYLDAIMLILKEDMKDKYDYISWWLYEDVEKEISFKDETGEHLIYLNTAENLYDFLIENYKED